MRFQPPTTSERASAPVRPLLEHAFVGLLLLSIAPLGCAHGLARDLSDETDLALEGETDDEDPAGTPASSSSASGGATTGGSATTSSSSSTTTGGTTSSGTTSSGTTSGGGSSSGDDSGTCDACGNCAIASYCQAEMNACDSSQDCVAFGSCLSSCQDDACFQGCETSYPQGEQLYLTWVTCILCTACYDDCDGASSGACF